MKKLFIALTLLLTTSALAEAPWSTPFAPNAGAIAVEAMKTPVRKDQGYQLLFADTSVDYDKDGLETLKYRLVLKVLTTEMAEKYGAIQVNWEPWHQERPEVRVRVIQPDSSVSNFDPSTLTEAAPKGSDDIYSNRKIVRGPIPNVHVGSIVEREITLREKPSLFQHRFVRTFSVASTYWFEAQRITVRAAANLPLHIGWRGEGNAPKIVREGEFNVARFEQSPTPAELSWPRHLPFDQPAMPELVVSIAPSWSEAAKAYGDVVDAQIKASDPVDSLAKELAGGEKDPVALTQKFSDWMHSRIRYTGLHFDEAAIIPRPPSETVTRGFGDCKDLATLMVALLRSSGVKANVALLNAADTDVPLDAPGLTDFDHAIVYVQGKSPFFIDATAEGAIAGQVSPMIAGRMTLVTDGSLKNPVVKIPDAKAEDHRWRLTREVNLAEIDQGTFDSQLEERGYWAEARRYWQRQSTQEEQNQRGKEYVKRVYGCDEVTHYSVDEGGLDKPTKTVAGGAQCAQLFSSDEKAEIKIPLFALVTDTPSELTGWSDDDDDESGEASEPSQPSRLQPLQWPVPYTAEANYRVVPAPGFRPVVTAETKSWKLGPASFERAISVAKDGSVSVKAKFVSGKRTWTPPEIESFKRAFKDFKESLDLKLRFEEIAYAEIAAGHVKEGLAEFQKAIARHPNEALHHVQYATALLDLGFGAAARAQVRRAVEIEPSNVAAHRVRAYVLQYDELGRAFSPGWDRAGSIAEYRKAIALQPDTRLSRRSLAHVLEMNEEGEEYGPGSDLEGAAQLYREAREKGKDDAQDLNLLIVLWRAGKAKEALELSNELPESKARTQIRIAAIAMLKGVDAALQEAAKLSNPADRGTLAVQVAAELVMQREYELGAKIRKALPLGSAQDDQQLRVLERAKRSEAVTIPALDPRLTVLRFFDAVTASDAAAAKRWISKAVQAEETGTLDFAKAMGRSLFGGSTIPRAVVKDFLYSVPEYKVDGTPALGARVTMAMLGRNDVSVFLVHEAGEWKIRAFDGMRETLAQEARSRLEKGDLAGAKKWAGWADLEQRPWNVEPEAERARLSAWPRIADLPPEQMKLALAWCMVDDSERDAAALKLLQSAKAANQAESTAIDWALARGLLKDSPEQALQSVERLFARRPSDELWYLKLQAYTNAKNKAEAIKTADAWIAEAPNEPGPMESAAWALTKLGDMQLARKYRTNAIATGRASYSIYNNQAWSELFDDPPSISAAEQLAIKANELSNYKAPHILHTLATVHAELGRGQSAHELLMKSVELENRTKLERYDWYVVGRIAESYGLSDVARESYARAMEEKPEKDRPEDAYLLAERRLNALGGTKTVTVTPP